MSDQEKKEPAIDQDAQAGHGQRSGRGGGRERKTHRRQSAGTRPLDESVNMEELRQIVELISEHGFTDFELENKDVRVRLRRELAPQIVSMPSSSVSRTEARDTREAGAVADQAVAGASQASPASFPTGESAAGAASGEEEDLHMITSPIVGTFFRAASPTADPFVRLGSRVDPDSIVCIIEAMKLMNEIQAETAGVVEKIYVENGQPVEYGQPLFGIKK